MEPTKRISFFNGSFSLSSGLVAIVYTVLSTASFVVLHGIVRGLSSSVPPIEIAFFGFFFAGLTYLPWLWRSGIRTLTTQRFGTHFLRSLFNAGAVITWFTALSLVPLAEATAVHMSSPVFVTIGAFFFLREKVNPRRWLAIGIGVIGTLVIVRPGLVSVNLGIVFVLISAVSSAGSWLIAKSLSNTDDSASSVFYLTWWIALIILVPALFVWQWPTLEEFLWFPLIGAMISLAHFTAMKGYKLADASALEPFRFVRLLFATAIGFFIFGEIPGIWSWIGGTMICSAMILAAKKETSRPPSAHLSDPSD